MDLMKTSILTENEYPFQFTVIMAVYNVEAFLNEAVDSLVEQSFGFEENIQLIMVDDGSNDGSGLICDEYQKRFPNNIKVIHKEKGGVASARNEGLKYAQGRYLNFMDSDDKFTKNTFSKVYNFFTKHEDETDIVTIPQQYFGGMSGVSWQNEKFKKGTRLINLRYEYKAALMTINSSFIHARRKGCIEFDHRLDGGGDLKTVVAVLLDKMRLGVVSGCKYMCRRTVGENSLIDTSKLNEHWYMEQLTYLTCWIHQYCIDKMGYYPLFAQYTIMADLRGKFFLPDKILGAFAEEEKEEYKGKLFEAVSFFDDVIVQEHKKLWIQQKIFVLMKKYNRYPDFAPIKNNAVIHFDNTVLGKVSDFYTQFDFIRIEQNLLILEGFTRMAGCSVEEPIDVYFILNGQERILAKRPQRDGINTFLYDENLFLGIPFYAEIPLDIGQKNYSIQLLIVFREMEIIKKKLRFGKFSPVGAEYKNSYYWKDGWLLSATENRLSICRCGRRGLLKRENAFLKELHTSKKASDRRAAKARVAYRILKFLIKKPIWLVSDRSYKADDNGEAFFRYLNEHHDKEVDSYFVLGKGCPDYERISKIGKVVERLSWKHKLLFLLCDCNISSQADTATDNPFQNFYLPYRDLMARHHFIFLQHGVIKDNLSSWLGRYQKNCTLFVTSAELEAKSLREENYYYDANAILLSGLPRFDRLYHDEQRIVTIMPTWRKYLTDGADAVSRLWKLGQKFLDSDYYQFYTELLQSERLLEAARKNHYQLAFMPHPTLQPFLELFQISDEVKVYGVETSYRDMYAKSDLLLTDYSSAVFDFAYLRKPVLYAHFDKEIFFAGNHVYTQGYFDYERDGFGEVEYDLESTIDRIIEYMENDCQLKEKYRQRIDKFFAYNDQNSCERVYEAIQKIKR